MRQLYELIEKVYSCIPNVYADKATAENRVEMAAIRRGRLSRDNKMRLTNCAQFVVLFWDKNALLVTYISWLVLCANQAWTCTAEERFYYYTTSRLEQFSCKPSSCLRARLVIHRIHYIINTALYFIHSQFIVVETQTDFSNTSFINLSIKRSKPLISQTKPWIEDEE